MRLCARAQARLRPRVHDRARAHGRVLVRKRARVRLRVYFDAAVVWRAVGILLFMRGPERVRTASCGPCVAKQQKMQHKQPNEQQEQRE